MAPSDAQQCNRKRGACSEGSRKRHRRPDPERARGHELDVAKAQSFDLAQPAVSERQCKEDNCNRDRRPDVNPWRFGYHQRPGQPAHRKRQGRVIGNAECAKVPPADVYQQRKAEDRQSKDQRRLLYCNPLSVLAE